MALGYTSEDLNSKSSDKNSNQESQSGADAYELYQNAVKQLTDVGSWSENLDGTVEINLVSADAKQKTRFKAYLDFDGKISDYNENDLSTLKVSASANIKAGGQETAFTANYENGIAHYQYTKPTSYSVDAELDTVYFKFSKLTPEMLQDASVAGNFINFTVSGNQMTELGAELVNMIDGVENLQYGDCDVDIILSEEGGKIEGINMKFHASMIYQGYTADADYDIDYHFSA